MADGRVTRREIAAEATRREILAAARRLFAARGYAATSIQQVATEAGVAVQTVYSSVGSKGALLVALNDLIDEEADIAQLVAEIRGQRDPAALLAQAVHLTRQLNERCGDLIGVLLAAEPAEPEVATAVADGMRRHTAGAAMVAGQLASLRALPRSMPAQRAADVFSLLTSPASWRQLTVDAGWSFDDAERWLVDALGGLVLRPGG